jgi:hypothetical protein
MSNLGKVGKCAMCKENKLLVSGRFSEGSPPYNSSYEWLICADCEKTRFLCEICQESTNSSSYEHHLRSKHTIDELAKKISDDKTK